MTVHANVRVVRAPRGTEISCKTWGAEAALRMLMNNLDPEVAERPDDLVVYGGTGRAARSWEAFDAIVATLRRLDANLAVSKVQTVEHAMAESLAQERLSALVSVAFAVVGLLLAALGLYGLLAYLVSQRTKEIGIRLALGASAAGLTRSVVASGYRLVVSGAVLGVAIALATSRLLSAMLFGVSPYDALTYAGVVLVLAIIAGIASYLPARAVTRVEPLLALRQE